MVECVAGCCGGRRRFLGGMGALGAGALSARALGAGPAEGVRVAGAAPYRIDTHHHLSSPAFIEEIRGRRTGQKLLEDWTPAQSIENMDRDGVRTAILSISEPGVHFGNDIAARRLARECNDYGASLMQQYPGRFGLFAILPLPDVEGGLREIEYALDTLHADGICMMTDYRGKFLGDPAFEPVMAELNRRRAIVYTHPFRNDCCRNLVPDTIEPVIELGTDTARTIASLLFSGSVERFSDIRFIFSHAGGTMPALMQRFSSWVDLRKDLAARLPQGLDHYVRRFYFDTANAFTPAPLAPLLQVAPVSQLLFGTDFPFVSAAETAAGLQGCGLFSATQLRQIEYGNAQALIPRLGA